MARTTYVLMEWLANKDKDLREREGGDSSSGNGNSGGFKSFIRTFGSFGEFHQKATA